MNMHWTADEAITYKMIYRFIFIKPVLLPGRNFPFLNLVQNILPAKSLLFGFRDLIIHARKKIRQINITCWNT